jgi:hypothetical protein
MSKDEFIVYLAKHVLMDIYTDMVRNNQLNSARLILQLLRRKYLQLGLGDTDWAVDMILEKLPFVPHYPRRGYSVEYKLRSGLIDNERLLSEYGEIAKRLKETVPIV